MKFTSQKRHYSLFPYEVNNDSIFIPYGNVLFRLVSKAYESLSIIITTNKDFAGWSEIFEDHVQVSALLDRLLHHSIIFAISGESYRMKGVREKIGKNNGHSS